MVVPLGLDTPRTEAGNATLTSNHGLDISFEPSFQSPSRDNNDLVSQMRNNRRPVDIKTPHSRAPFADRRNGAATGAKGEFTPLLKSVTKTNMSRRPSKDGKMATPAFLKQVHETSLLSPALSMENSAIYGDGASSFQGQDETPMPQMASSSANTTPLAMLPRRDGGGVLADGANMMTLREQENIINKIEKENFGLKLKIHFLEEALRKAGPGFSEAALKENTDLKVDKVTMQKELHRYRKTLGAAERDLESYRQQVIEAQERAKRKHVDEEQREELQRLKQALADSEAETQRLREELDSTGGRNGDVSRMRNEMGDVEAELREKERIIEEQEDEIDGLKEKVTRGTSSSTDLEEELATMQDRVQELEEKKSGSKEALEEAQTDLAESRDLVKALEARVTRLHTHTKDVEQKVQDAEERAEEAEKSARILREEGQAEALSAAQADLDEAREDVRSLKETVEDLRSELDDQRREKEGIEDRMEEMENAPSSEGEERARALEDSRTELAECRRAIKALEDGVDRLQTEVDAANQRRRQAEEKAQDLENENQSEALKNAHDNLIETRQTVKTLEARAGDLQAQLEEANGQIQELEAAMDRAEGRDDKLKDALNDANDELAARRNEINDLEDALDGLKAQLDEARTARSEATESKFMAEAIATAKDQSLRDTQDEVKKYRRQIQELETERDHIRSERRVTDDSWREKELEKSIERLKLEVKNANEKMQGARQERSQAQISLAESQTKVRLLEADLDRTRSEIWHTNQKAKEWEEKAQGLEDEVIFLQGNLDEEGHHAKQEVATARLELAHETERARMEEKRSEIEISGLQAELSVAREGKERELVSAKRNVQRLELRVKELEGQQSSHVVDQGQSMAAERKELHGKLREAKIELEELREQMVEPEQKLADVLHREQELRTQLKRAREDRAGQAQRVNTKAFELDSLQRRYDRTVGKHARLQQGWEDERKAMMQRVRFANTSVSSIRHDDPAEVAQLEHQVVEKEKRHQSEIRGLAKQIMYLRKKCEREEGFRADLAFSKQYFLLQIEMYDTCNHADLQMLAQMGITPDRSIRERRPSLRIVAFMVIASVRMRKRQEEWGRHLKVKEGLARAAEQTKRRARRSAIV